MTESTKSRGLLTVIGPGILVAATGVGAGDLATASFTGANVGLVVLWAVVLGAFLKFVLNEGLTRWQLATGSTLVEGCVKHLGRPVRWVFFAYLIVWSFLVAAALMSAIGVTGHAILPLTGTDADAAQTDKIIYGILHSALAVLLVKLGGYRLFERVMGVCIGLMFVTVVVTAVALAVQRPEIVGRFVGGLFVPRLPTEIAGGVSWTIALLGGVGGTVTILCYGYWIREEGRQGTGELATCRIDLATGYLVTAIFGLAMVVIGSSLPKLEGGGATLIVHLAEQLGGAFGAAGPLAKWAFLIGAWGAVFSSLLGVWQSIPYLFADLWGMRKTEPASEDDNPSASPSPIWGGESGGVNTKGWPYRAYLYGIASVPILGLAAVNFQAMQKVYAVVGALFIPMLAGVLLVMNGRPRWVGEKNVNSLVTTLVLVGAMLFFLVAGGMHISEQLAID